LNNKMEDKSRIVIPPVEEYRAGIPVLTDSKPKYKIVTPRYDNFVMTGRVLNPVLRRREIR